ncbi:hypothetical protein HWV62_34115 [Athelia sp. TMB]|nr:hypothetical protein HWV62_34115 [Athelia sp. TMB]
MATTHVIEHHQIIGFESLRREDQAKVDPSDIPASARIQISIPAGPTTASAPVLSQKKRKAAQVAAQMETPGSQIALPASQPVRSLTQTMARETEEEAEQSGAYEEEPRDELYCVLNSKIVGVQYYTGMVGPGEEVNLIREPHNKYDRHSRNAIAVKNIANAQIGHIPREVASKMAPLMDKGLITAEAVMHEGNRRSVKFYARSNLRDQVEPLLLWATPGRRGFPTRNNSSSQPVPGAPSSSQRYGPSAVPAPVPRASSQSRPTGITAAQIKAQEDAIRRQESLMKAQELKTMLNNLEKVDDEGRRTSLLDKLCPTDDILNLPLHPDPPGTKNGQLTVDLLKHQSQALQWCIEREYPILPKKESDKPVQFWQKCHTVDKKTPQANPPALGRGALCADSMGLGKTLTMISLILATQKDLPPDFSKATLIVVPLSVMSNWEKQIEDHCVPGALTSCVYYGSKRNMSPSDLGKHDVTVAGEHDGSGVVKMNNEGPSKKKKKIEKGLFDVQWKRIILDEGHTIRNPKTKMAKAVCALAAQRRWVLSGTPIINSPRDLGSMLTFLQICQPLDNEDFFKRLLLRPLKDGDPSGVELLRALMSQICIRRTKEMQDADGNHLVPLPPVEVIVVPVTLDDAARELYDAVEQVSKERVERMMDSNGSSSPMVTSSVLSMLTRMRQIALHPGLVPSNYLEQLQALEDDHSNAPPAIRITPADKNLLQDRRPITMSDLIEPPPPTELTQVPVHREEEQASGVRAGSSAKIDQLVHLLQLTPAGEKSLVFSQFTGFLDKIGEALEEQGISFVRFDGQMSAKRRQETIQRFSVPLDESMDNSVMEIKDQAPLGRTRRAKKQPAFHDNLIDEDDIQDSDFTMPIDDDDDDDFLDDEVDNAFSNKASKKGKGKAAVKSRKGATCDDFELDDANPKVMLISLKAGALGLNLTVANNVYLMDPWWQEGIESQAIDRCNRIGQKKSVHVYQLIAENTVEAKVIDIQEKKKNLITAAFSGIKRVETQRQKKEARLQGPPLGNPILGQFGNIIRGEAGIVQREWSKQYGPVVRAVGPFGIERLMFMKPEAMQKILVSDWVEYPRPTWMRDVLGAVTGYGLLTVTGNEHKQMRKAMNPGQITETDMYYDPIESQVVSKLVKILDAQVQASSDQARGAEIPIYEWMSKVALDIICIAAFDYKTDSLHNPHNELAEAYEEMISLQSEEGAIIANSMHIIKKVSAQLLKEKVADAAVVAADMTTKRDIMSILVRARISDKGEGYQMTDGAMMDQVTLWLLANDIPAQEKLRQECSALIANNPRPDYRSLKELQYLDCVIQESLRVLPPVPMTFRQAGKSDYIDGVLVPKGTIFYIPIRGINTAKETWGEDAEE